MQYVWNAILTLRIYLTQNLKKQTNKQENRSYQPRPHYRASPPDNQQPYGGYGPSNRNDNFHDGPQRDPPPPSSVRSDDSDAAKPQPPPQQKQQQQPPRNADPPVAERVLDKNNYNPAEIDTDAMEKARYV